MPVDGFVFELFALGGSCVASVGVRFFFLAVEQVVGLVDVGHVGGGGHGGVDKAAVAIRSNVGFEAKVVLFSFARVPHFRVAFFLFVLGRAGGGDDGGVDHRALAHEQAALAQELVEAFKYGLAKFVSFQQMAEFEKRGGIRHFLHAQVDAGKIAHRLAIVERVLKPLVGQRIPELQK